MLTSPEVLSGVVAAGLYAGTLGADFCYDDSRAIKSNQDLRPDVPWTHVFFDDFWGTPLTHSGSHKSFRPLCTLSFRLNYALGGLEPWGYHLVNVGLHAACSTAYTRLTGKLLPGKAWSFLAGLLFAVHPIHTEAVAGVVGRADVGAGLFFLLSLLSYVRYCQSRDGGLAMDEANCGQGRGKRWAWLSGSLVCAAASMLWKEQGVTVLMVAAVYDIFVHSGLTIADLLLLLCKARWSCILSMSKFENSVRRARWVKGRGSLGSEFE